MNRRCPRGLLERPYTSFFSEKKRRGKEEGEECLTPTFRDGGVWEEREAAREK